VWVRWFVSFAIACFLIPLLRAADRSVEPIISHIVRAPVESTALAAVGYSKRLHALEIEFRDGLIYRYLEVPRVTYRELVTAESKARYYNQKVRGKYHCLRVRGRRSP
jgi:hypothetical protein